MRLSAIILVALAGLAYCAAAWTRWRALAKAPGEPGPANPSANPPPWLWLGFAAHTLALILALCQSANRDFAYVVLAAWAAVAALSFARGFINGPSRALLALPAGAMALLVAMAGAAGSAPVPPNRVTGAITALHIAFMVAHLAAIVVAGAAGGLYLVAARQLKTASRRAFALPSLPTLERLDERALIVATALLLGGLATGGAAIEQSPDFHLTNPTALLGLATMAVLIPILALHGAGRLNGSRLAAAAVGAMALAFLGFLSLQVLAHG